MKVTLVCLEKPAVIKVRTSGVRLNKDIFFVIKASIEKKDSEDMVQLWFEIWRRRGHGMTNELVGEDALGHEFNLTDVASSVFRDVTFNQILRYSDRSEGNVILSIEEILAHRIAEFSRLHVSDAKSPKDLLLRISLYDFGDAMQSLFACNDRTTALIIATSNK